MSIADLPQPEQEHHRRLIRTYTKARRAVNNITGQRVPLRYDPALLLQRLNELGRTEALIERMIEDIHTGQAIGEKSFEIYLWFQWRREHDRKINA
jgi:hypothetical protein